VKLAKTTKVRYQLQNFYYT